MISRVKLTNRILGGGNYFTSPKKNVQFIPTGCKTLDLALGGGGWAKNRIANIIGDKSTGKTLLCIEAASNFAIQYPKGKIRYREAESAFDPPYANALGMPLDRVDFGDPLETVEDLFEDLARVTKGAKQEELYILDSLDALSDRDEMVRDMDEGSYGTAKAKKMSQMFRRMVRELTRSKVTLIIVSQIRSKIGFSKGRTTTRSGGRALDFYASQVLFVTHIGAINRTVHGVKRPSGIKIKAKVEKNKIGLPFREAAFNINFGFGIDDLGSCLDFLVETKYLKTALGVKIIDVAEYKAKVNKMPDVDYRSELKKIRQAVEDRWYEIETSFIPTRKKYG